ncbi:MAG TPA: hypothetical protein PKD53_25230 [Chloroflexaceae bacterium]|nr:hypothetical protein [Chloroflexaceae bacterium]
MNRRLARFVLTAVAVVALHGVVMAIPARAVAQGATQIRGIGYPDVNGLCTDLEEADFDFAMVVTGDLEGGLYTQVASAECSPSGTYRERGRETFVGTYNGQEGGFQTTFLFTSKWEDCENLDTEIFGRCQHPIVAGSGREVFEGVSGRLDFKDDIAAGNFPYRGHLRW